MLLARGDTVIFEGAYGLADRELGVANTLETRFPLASVTKIFIGVAVAQLAQAGRLSFDQPLADFVPEYPRHIAEKVTVHHLLTHTSGIELDDHPEYNQAVAAAASLADLLAAQLRFVEHLNRGNYESFEPLGRFDYNDRKHREMVMTPHVETIRIGSLTRSYGYTFEVDRLDGLVTVGHGGGAPGVSTQLEIYPETGHVAVVLSNFDRSAARNVSSHIKELIGF